MLGFVGKLESIEGIAACDTEYRKKDLVDYYGHLEEVVRELELISVLDRMEERRLLETFMNVLKDRTSPFTVVSMLYQILYKVAKYTYVKKNILLRNNELTYEIKISETSLRMYMQGLKKRIEEID